MGLKMLSKKTEVLMNKKRLILIIALVLLVVGTVSVFAATRCNYCQGTGYVYCSACNGTGQRRI